MSSSGSISSIRVLLLVVVAHHLAFIIKELITQRLGHLRLPHTRWAKEHEARRWSIRIAASSSGGGSLIISIILYSCNIIMISHHYY